eukprot:s1213_g13.t1
MCGRGALTLSGDKCRRIAGGARRGGFTKVRNAEKLKTKYNLGPMNYVPVVRSVEGSGPYANFDREVCAMRWGLVPSFAKNEEEYNAFKGGNSTFNARIEGAETRNLWRRLLDKRRCIVLFDGFYEWKAHVDGKTKIPMFIRNKDEYDGHVIPWPTKDEADEDEKRDGHAPLLLAGLYDTWQDDSKELLESVTILTMDPQHTAMEKVHDRMPVFLTPDSLAFAAGLTAVFDQRVFSSIAAAVLHQSECVDRPLLIFRWRNGQVKAWPRYLATHFYFCFYHALGRKVLRWVSRSFEPTIWRRIFYGSTVPWLRGTAPVCVMSYTVAFMETFTISAFPYYTFENRSQAYTVGSAFYAIYLVISLPLFARLDEMPGSPGTRASEAREHQISLTDWLQGSRLLRRFFLSFSDPSWADDPRSRSFLQFPGLCKAFWALANWQAVVFANELLPFCWQIAKLMRSEAVELMSSCSLLGEIGSQRVLKMSGPSNAPQFASLYVGDLHPDVTEAMLYEIFNAVGPVASIRVCRDAVTRKSLGYGYVNFHSVPDAERALDTLNYSSIRGRSCRIMWCQRDPTLRKTGAGNIYVSNLDPNIDNKALYDTFSLFGNILSCKVASDSSGKSHGYGFVHYEFEDAARQVCLFQKRDKEAEKQNFTNLYVKYYPQDWDEAKLMEFFSQCGPVTAAAVKIDEKGRKFAFVNYESSDDAKKCVEELHGMDSRDLREDKEAPQELGPDGHPVGHLYVQRAQTKKERQAELRSQFSDNRPQNKAVNLYVKNLDTTVEDADLSLSCYGRDFAPLQRLCFHGSQAMTRIDVTSASVAKDATGKCKGFGFVCLSAPEDATKAVTEMHLKVVKGKPLYVGLAERKEARQERLRQRFTQPANYGNYGGYNSYGGKGKKGGKGKGYGKERGEICREVHRKLESDDEQHEYAWNGNAKYGRHDEASADDGHDATSNDVQRRWTKCFRHEGRHALHGEGSDASDGTRSDEPHDGHAAKHADATHDEAATSKSTAGHGASNEPDEWTNAETDARREAIPNGRQVPAGAGWKDHRHDAGNGQQRADAFVGFRAASSEQGFAGDPTSGPLQLKGTILQQGKHQYLQPQLMPDAATVIIDWFQMRDSVPSVAAFALGSRLFNGLQATKVGRYALPAWSVVVGLVRCLPDSISEDKTRWLDDLISQVEIGRCRDSDCSKEELKTQALDLPAVAERKNLYFACGVPSASPPSLSFAKCCRSASTWLDLRLPFTEIVGSVLKAAQAHAQSQLLLYEVSSLVSNIKNESPDCILSKKEYSAKQLTKGIGRFFKSKNEGTKQEAKEGKEGSSEAPTKVVNLD